MGAFDYVGGLSPRRSGFNLPERKICDFDMGDIIPVYCRMAIPGDVWKFNFSAVLRAMPMVAPTFTSIDCSVYAFFVPFRLLWSKWDKFCTGGKDGNFNELPPHGFTINFEKYSLGDYFGFPVGSNIGADTSKTLLRSAFPFFAYNLIYNTYWRDENIDLERVDCGDVYEFDSTTVQSTGTYNIAKSRWRKDYFTSALPFQERGTPPAMFFSNAPVIFTNHFAAQTSGSSAPIIGYDTSGQSPTGSMFGYNGSGKILTFKDRDGEVPFSANNLSGVADLSGVGFTTNDLRLLTQVQKFLERNARGGYRYNEWLLAHYGVAPRDETLQRPQFLGGAHFPVIISEVLQTSASSSDSALGNYAGHGMGVSRNHLFKFHAKEFGVIMVQLTLRPRRDYIPQGFPREWLFQSRYDLPLPEFVGLSEQPVYEREIFAKVGQESSDVPFGYQGRFNEYRTSFNKVVGGLRDTYKYWTFADKFSSAPGLNSQFLECNPTRDPFAVQSSDVKTWWLDFRSEVKAYRPLPYVAEPGYMDHF